MLKRRYLMFTLLPVLTLLAVAGPAISGMSLGPAVETQPEQPPDNQRPPERPPKTHALLVAVSKYDHLDQSLQLRGPHNDLQLLRHAIASRGVADRDVLALEDPTAGDALAALRDLAGEARAGDSVFVWWGGHAVESASGELLLLGRDVTAWDNETLPDAVVRGGQLQRILLDMRNHGVFVVLALDTTSAGSLKLRSAIQEPVWHLGADARTERAPGSLVPKAGGFASFMAAPAGGDTAEMRLPKDSPQRKSHGLFSFALANALIAPDVSSYRDAARKIADWYVAGHHDTWSSPVFEMSDPERQLLDASATSANQAKPADTAVTTAPKPASRGLDLADESTVKARIADPRGLQAVLVNGQEVSLQRNGVFSAAVGLQPGRNKVEILAVYEGNRLVDNSVTIDHQPRAEVGAGKRYALVIGNQRYTDPSWPALNTPAADAAAIAELLQQRYGFLTTIDKPDGGGLDLVLIDANRQQILSHLSQLRKLLSPLDSLLVYYAGHGHMIRNHGYWIPVDGTVDDFTWISAFKITEQLALNPARHVLVISDSCYSGALTRSGRLTPDDAGDRGKALNKFRERKSRMLLSSGSNEPVWDGGGDNHSVFAQALLDGLGQLKERQFTFHDVFPYILEVTAGRSEQVPQFSVIRNSGHEGGALVVDL